MGAAAGGGATGNGEAVPPPNGSAMLISWKPFVLGNANCVPLLPLMPLTTYEPIEISSSIGGSIAGISWILTLCGRDA